MLLGSQGSGLLGSHKAIYTRRMQNRYTAITVVRSGKVSVMVVMGLSTCSGATSNRMGILAEGFCTCYGQGILEPRKRKRLTSMLWGIPYDRAAGRPWLNEVPALPHIVML